MVWFKEGRISRLTFIFFAELAGVRGEAAGRLKGGMVVKKEVASVTTK